MDLRARQASAVPTVAAVAPSGVVVAGLSAGDETSEVPVTLWDGDYVTLQDEQLIPASDAPQRHSSGKGSAPAVGVVHCAERGRALVVAHGVCWCWTLRLATNAHIFLARRLPSETNAAAFGTERSRCRCGTHWGDCEVRSAIWQMLRSRQWRGSRRLRSWATTMRRTPRRSPES